MALCTDIYFDDILSYQKHKSDHLDYLQQVLKVLRKKQVLHRSQSQEVHILTKSVIFLKFVIGAKVVQVDEEMVQTIREWLAPKIASGAQNFRGLESFFHIFIQLFSTIMVAITEFMKRGKFYWG